MTEQPGNQDEAARGQSFTKGLPTFPGDAEDAPPPPMPNRARTWGKYGALCGAVCGGVVGAFTVLVSLLYGAPSPAEAVGIFFGAPVTLGVLGGIAWGIRGALRDHRMESRDLEKQREAERRHEEDREWHAVKRILKRKQDGF